LERKISAPAIQFKGSGWYVTDYARTTKSDKTESESVTESKTEKTEKKSKESSPAKNTSDKSSSPKVSSGD
jgi:predicted nucleic acid-binding Zn ribbon protein